MLKRALIIVNILILVFLLGSVPAFAAPDQINYQGTLTDSVGNPVDGVVQITFALYDVASAGAGTALWTEVQDVTVSHGVYSVRLGSVTPLDASLFSGARFLSLTVGGEELSPRIELTSAPNALVSDFAYSVDWSGITNIPADIADGDQDTTLSEAQVDAFVANNGFAIASELNDSDAATTPVTWKDISGIPADIADGDQDTHVTSVDGLTGGLINGGVGVNSPSFNDAGLRVVADGVDDYYAGYFAMNAGPDGPGDLYRYGLYTENNASGNFPNFGLLSRASNAGSSNWGIQSEAVGGGGAYGVNAIANSASSDNIGVIADANSTIGFENKGVYASASGGSNANYGIYGYVFNGSQAPNKGNYGVYGYAAGNGYNYGIYGATGGTGWAGYFEGSVNISQDLNVSGDIYANGSRLSNLDWNKISNVPADIADGDQDTHVTSVDGLSGGWITSNVGIGVTEYSLFRLSVQSDEIPYAGHFVSNYSSSPYGVGYGIYTVASGSGNQTNYGIYASASGATKNYAGFFEGDVTIRDQLYLNATSDHWNVGGGDYNLLVGDTTNNLKIGVATGGAGAGTTRIFAEGTAPRVVLGSGSTTDVLAVYNGNVGIGTLNPTYKLYVAGNAYTTGTWGSSDRRWKKNIFTLRDALYKVSQLRGVSFDWRTDEFPDKGFSDKPQIGVIAQEVEQVVPELVHTDSEGYKAVAYDKLTALLIEAVKELKSQNDALKTIVCREHPEATVCK